MAYGLIVNADSFGSLRDARSGPLQYRTDDRWQRAMTDIVFPVSCAHSTQMILLFALFDLRSLITEADDR